MRYTKIVATIGPASNSDDMLDAMIKAGVNVVRLNFSHGTHESHAASVRRIRSAADRAGRDIAILQDLPGPKIRTGPLRAASPIPLTPGDPLIISTGNSVGRPGHVSTSFAGLAQGVKPGDRLLLSDGLIELRVDRFERDRHSNNGRGRWFTRPAQRHQRARRDASGVGRDAERRRRSEVRPLARRGLVALSFVQTAADLRRVRMLTCGGELRRHADRRQARTPGGAHAPRRDSRRVRCRDGGQGRSGPRDAARSGAAGAEGHHAPGARPRGTGHSRNPGARVDDRGGAADTRAKSAMPPTRLTTVSTPSCCRAKRPSARTRRGSSDTLDAVIRDAESSPARDDQRPADSSRRTSHAWAICEAAVTLTAHQGAQAIVAVTRGGSTAQTAVVPPSARADSGGNREPGDRRRLAVCWGVRPVHVNIGEALEHRRRDDAHRPAARGVGLVPAGSTLVFVSIDEDDRREPTPTISKLQRL